MAEAAKELLVLARLQLEHCACWTGRHRYGDIVLLQMDHQLLHTWLDTWDKVRLKALLHHFLLKSCLIEIFKIGIPMCRDGNWEPVSTGSWLFMLKDSLSDARKKRNMQCQQHCHFMWGWKHQQHVETFDNAWHYISGLHHPLLEGWSNYRVLTCRYQYCWHWKPIKAYFIPHRRSIDSG